jgi:hypothetical protein
MPINNHLSLFIIHHHFYNKTMGFLGLHKRTVPARVNIAIYLPPSNPKGRTGMIGRGLLGRFGPNHAADPIVSRWVRDSQGAVVLTEGNPQLEFVAIERKDNKEWAIPGVSSPLQQFRTLHVHMRRGKVRLG